MYEWIIALGLGAFGGFVRGLMKSETEPMVIGRSLVLGAFGGLLAFFLKLPDGSAQLLMGYVADHFLEHLHEKITSKK